MDHSPAEVKEENVIFHRVARRQELRPGEPKRVNVEGLGIALYDLAGVVHATADLCTHGLASLSDGYIDGGMIECPLHGGAFDIATGQPVKPPCVERIQVYPVRVEGGFILVGVPK